PLPEQNIQYVGRLLKLTRDVTEKQIAMLEEAGVKLDATVNFHELRNNPAGIKIIDQSISVKVGDGTPYTMIRKQVSVEFLKIEMTIRELQVRLIVWTPPHNVEPEADVLFWVGFFNSPALDNIRLPQGFRCSIVLREFEDEGAEITFIHFPSSLASHKDKFFYDEILHNLRNPPQPQDLNTPR